MPRRSQRLADETDLVARVGGAELSARLEQLEAAFARPSRD